MITAPLLEIAILTLGMVILMVEAFARKIDKRVLVFAAITGLGIIFVASFFVDPSQSPPHVAGFWSFYTADRLSIFFKQFALVTTIFVLLMAIDYAPVLRSSFAGDTTHAGLGEFVALPLFTCAGLMYLVSAIDFVFIFVSLELVTVSFSKREPNILCSARFPQRSSCTESPGYSVRLVKPTFTGSQRRWRIRTRNLAQCC
jgi:NADH-quinone oxidoreductase subunit N